MQSVILEPFSYPGESFLSWDLSFYNLAIWLCVQGGPHNHTIGGLAVCLKQAAAPGFKVYQQQVILL
jgi:glycine hydroxymethyltransferase